MISKNPIIQHRTPRIWLTLLLATVCTVHTFGADTEPSTPEAPPPIEAPAAPVAPDLIPEITPPLEAPVPTAADPAERAAPVATTRRSVYREQLVGIFQDVHLRAHEAAEQVVAVFGDVLVEGRVDEQVVGVFGNTDVRSRVDGNVVTVFGNSTITQDVEGDVVCVFGDLNVGSGVHIGGELVSVGGHTSLDPSTFIDGEQVSIPIPGLRHFGSWVRECLLKGRLYAYNRASTWVFVGVMLLLSLLAAAVFRGPVDSCVSVLERRPSAAIFNGILGALLVPAGMFLVAATGVGVIVVPFLWVGVMFATLVGAVAIARFTGTRLGLGTTPLLALVGGHVILAALYALPVVGLLVWAGVMMFAFGVAMTALLESRRREAQASGPASTPLPVIPPSPPAPSPAASAMVPPPTAMGFTAEIQPPPPAPTGTMTMPEAAGALPPPPPPPPSATTVLVPPQAQLALERAGFWPRIAANLLDLAFVVVANVFVLPMFPFPFLWLAYHIGFWAWRATTLGGVVMNLRIDRLDGRKVDFAVALVRGLGSVVSFAPLCLGFLWVNWDPERQSWHDKLAGTVVVRVPRGQSLI